MPIISADPIDKKIFRITLTSGYGEMQNIVISADGLYSIYFIKDGKCINATGKIVNVVQNRACPKNSYILFDYSDDNINRKERIMFYQVQSIKDITPNDAYHIALEHGFVGTVEEWLESLKGESGKSAYELALDAGFEGTLEEYMDSLKGLSAYQIALEHGFLGTEEQWLESLNGPDGKSAYEVAVKHGYTGDECSWLASLKGSAGKSAYEIAVDAGFEGTEAEWLESLKGDTGKSAYEIAIEKGFEGTEEEWFAQNGDVTLLQQEVAIIKSEHLTWVDGMTTVST